MQTPNDNGHATNGEGLRCAGTENGIYNSVVCVSVEALLDALDRAEAEARAAGKLTPSGHFITD